MKTRADLMATSRGFWQARALLTAVELGVFDALGRRRLSAATLAKRAQSDPRATEMLLDALVGLGVLAKSKTAYAIHRDLTRLLAPGPGSALDMLRHHAHLWTSWSRLTDCVRDGGIPEPEEGFRRGLDAARAFTLAMRAGARHQAETLAGEVSFRGRRRLLDLGGGPGTYAAAFARRTPGLEVTVVDLPDVCRVGETLVAEETDVADRIAFHAANLDTEPLPQGADAAFLSHVIHSQSEAQIQALFAKVSDALAPGGLFVVRDFFTSPDRTSPPSASLFSLNMLVNTIAGRSYSAKETSAWLRKAGFASVRSRRSKGLPDTGYVLARS